MIRPAGPVVCPILIGRAGHVDALQRLIDEVCAGQGRTGLVAGEAGIGKSRLVAEVTTSAAQRGLLILQGSCFEYDQVLPYAPILDLLLSWLSAQPPGAIAECLGPSAAELVKLLPELAAMLPGITPSPALDPEQDKRRLFHALAGLFLRLAEAQPVLAIFEDLHWSDDTTLELLLHLTRRLRSQHLLILMTYRSDEVGVALAHFLAELDRQRLAVELILDRLTRAEVDVMLRAILNLQRPIRRELLEPIYQLTDGNPFFTEEVVRSLLTANHVPDGPGAWDHVRLDALRIPRTVQDAVRRRSEQLSQAARRTLAVAAVIGRRFDLDLLQELTRLDGETLLDAIKEAVAAHLVVEESAERFVFRHALTREALYSQLLARERRELHRAIAETLERTAGDAVEARLDDLAYHFFAAAAWEQALEYGQRAGARAQRLYALRSAVAHFDRALEAAERLAALPPLGLLRTRGLARETLGNFEGALADHRGILEAAAAAGDRRAQWQALLDLGLLWAGRDYAQTGACYRRALDLADAMGDPAALAQSWNHLGNWYLNVGQPETALDHHQRALAIFQQQGDRAGLAQTLDLLGMANYLRGDLCQSTGYYQQAVALFRALGDQQELVSVLGTLGLCGGSLQSEAEAPGPIGVDQALRASDEALRLTREMGWAAGEAYCLFEMGYVLGMQGEYDRALAAAYGALEIAREIEHHQWTAAALCVLGALHVDLLDAAAARDLLREALALAESIGSRWWAGIAAAMLASALILERDVAAAAALLDRAGPLEDPSQGMAQRLAHCVRGELALAQGDAGRALEIAEALIAGAPGGDQRRVVPRLWKLRGEALAALGQDAPAEAGLRSARQEAADRGARPIRWRIDLALGRLLQAQGRRQEARRALAAACQTIEELAAGIREEPRRARFLRASTALLPRSAVASPRALDRAGFGGLTQRERQVAALIAGGRSNRAIADQLVVGERTVESHVSSILTKLDFSSRAQIAAWAAELGLAAGAE